MSRIRANQITNQAADGAPTVQNGLVISGVTTSTSFSGSGASLTNLNASNIASGTVPTARLGSGTANSSTFLRGDSTFATVTSTTINNNADNRVITGSGTANTLNAESVLTFDGTVLTSDQIRYSGGGNKYNGHPRSVVIGYSGSNYANLGMGWVPTSTNDQYTSANTDYQSRLQLYDGLQIYGSGASVTSGQTVTWKQCADFKPSAIKLYSDGNERLRIASDGSCYFGPQIITESDMNWGHDAHQRPFVFSGNQAGVNPADATIVVANPNTNPSATRLGSFMFGCKTSSGGNSGIKAYIEGWTTSNPSNAYEAGGYIKFVTRQSGGTLTEHFKIDHDGKLYKSGNQFYPLVNYTEVATFGAASVSSNSYTDLRTIYSSYTPKKAGNLIVIHHQSQLWQGGHASGSGDAMWRLLRDEGSGFSEIVKNERIMGNMDGRNYTGGSGLARHHRTVHLMGSFICNGNNFSLKTQGKVDHTNVTLQWYHNSENILQIFEYEKG
jgi:hypothetical protein